MPMLDNVNHELFAQHYALNGHITQAGKLIGFVKSKAWALRQRADIQERVQELIEQRFSKASITAERTMKELARIAFADIRDLYDDNGDLLPVHLLPDDVAATVARIEVEIESRDDGDAIADGAEPGSRASRTLIITKKIRQADKMAALALLARHFKIVGEEGDGMNALANALADRLKAARRREYADVVDADYADPATPRHDPKAPGQRLEYGLASDPSSADDVSTPRLILPVRDPNALHSALPIPQQQRLHGAPGAPHEDEPLW